MFLRGVLYKRPFQRQQMASDWRLAFFERNLTEETWKGGRDIGVSDANRTASTARAGSPGSIMRP